MMLKHFFDISTGFRYKKNGKEFSVGQKTAIFLKFSAIYVDVGLGGSEKVGQCADVL